MLWARERNRGQAQFCREILRPSDRDAFAASFIRADTRARYYMILAYQAHT